MRRGGACGEIRGLDPRSRGGIEGGARRHAGRSFKPHPCPGPGRCGRRGRYKQRRSTCCASTACLRARGRRRTHGRKAGNSTTYFVSYPGGTAEIRCGLSSGRLCGVQRDRPSRSERGAERTRRSLGVYRPGVVWRGINDSRGATGWLVGITPRGGLEGVRLAQVAWEGT